MNAIFSYKESKIYIQCNLEDKILNICQKFSSKIGQDIESKIFIFMGKVLNLDSTLAEQLKGTFDKSSDITEVIIQVYDNDKDTVLIKYSYDGQDKEVKLKKGENILKRISSLIKQPYEKINILYNGEIATQEDFNKGFDDLANNQNKENNSMSLLIFDRSKTIEENENDKKDENSKDDKSKRKYVVKEFVKFLQKMNYILIIQYAFILLFGQLGFYFKINEIFTQSLGSILGTFIPITLISIVGGYFTDPTEVRKYLNKQVIYVFLSLFAFIPIFYCFLLSKYIDKNFITCGIILFFTDIFCSTLYSIIFKEYIGIFILLSSSAFNVITIVLYCKFMFDEINGSKITILIFMALIMCLYIIIHYMIIKNFVSDDEAPIAALNFNYLFFLPITFVVIFGPLILVFILVVIIAGVIMILALVFYVLGMMIYASLFIKRK
jgi:hypothetical protein